MKACSGGGLIEDACGEVTGHPDRNNAKPWSLTCWLVGWSVPGRRSVEDKFGLERGLSRSSWTSVLPIGRRRVSLRCSTGVFCAGLWLESCHDWGRRGQGRVSRANGRAGMLDVLVGRWVGPWGEVSLRQVRARTWSTTVVVDKFSARRGVVGCHLWVPRGSFAQVCGSKVVTTG